MSDLIRREDAINAMAELQGIAQSKAELTGISKAWKRIKALPTAFPWHRVEEGLPEPHKDVLVTGMEAINNSRVYKVMVNDDGTWRPTDYAPSILWDYWMPIEPPKEDA